MAVSIDAFKQAFAGELFRESQVATGLDIEPKSSGDPLEGRHARVRKAVKADPRLRSAITVANRTGSDMRLVKSGLKFNTARFVPAAPAVIAAGQNVTFQVVDPQGAGRTGGVARYHFEQKKRNVDVTLVWEGLKAEMVFTGDPHTINPKTQAVVDSESGNTYFFGLVEHQESDPLHLLIHFFNNTEFGLVRESASLEDPEHSEFSPPPPAAVPRKGVPAFFVQVFDEEHPEGAGSMSYRIQEAGRQHVARMKWRRGGRPVGLLEPNDGRFIVQARPDGPNDFRFELKHHDGPPPQPPGPTVVTIVNKAGFRLQREMLQLDQDKARFRSEPAQVIEGGSRTQFLVEAPDPEFPDRSGIVAYAFSLPKQGGGREASSHVVAMDWRSEPPPSFAHVSPAAENVEVAVDGGNSDSITFTITGPALDFTPPEKVKQPTLRKGDKGADGWVEYLQAALNHHIGAGLTVNGDFDKATKDKVEEFQRSHEKDGCMVDGIVGDQTWSFLRIGVFEKPRTDGRKPHTYVEKGLEARWLREKSIVRYEPPNDALVMQAISVGDTDTLEGQLVRIRITGPTGEQKVIDRPLGAGQVTSTSGQGFVHDVSIVHLGNLFDADGPAPAGDYRVEAYFDHELGGDKLAETVTVATAPSPRTGE